MPVALDVLLASLFAGGTRYQRLADERGSVVALTNASAGLAGVNRYAEHGVSSASDRFQYTGRAYLPLGLYRYRALADARQLERFLQTDPILQVALDLEARLPGFERRADGLIVSPPHGEMPLSSPSSDAN